MRFNIESPGINLRESTQEVIEQKFSKLEKMFNGIDRCEITLRMEDNDKQNEFLVEASLHVPGATLFAKEQATSIEAAATEVALDLQSQLRKYKDRMYQKR